MIRVMMGAATLALGGLLFYQWADWPPPTSPLNAPARPDHGVVDDAPTQSDPLSRLAPLDTRDSYAAVSERTLFRPDRKPRAPEAPDAEPEPPPEEAATLDGMDLSAVVITPTLVAAWVKDPADDKLVHLRLGEELAGWSVKEILNDRVVLERQGETDTLKLRDFSAGQAPGAPAPPNPRSRGGAPGRPAVQPRAVQRPGVVQPGARRRAQGPNRGQPVAPPRAPQSRTNVPRPLPPRPD